MSKRQQFEFQVVTDFINLKLKRKEAAQLLEIRERTVSRKARKIEERGLLGIVHGNHKKTPKNKISKDYKENITTLIKKQYFDFNMTHCLEKLVEEHSFKYSYATLRRWMTEIHLVKNRKRRSSKIRNHRDRMPSEGLLIQFDGSPHKYNGRDEWCLIAAIDDASSELLYGEFFLSEDTLNCLKVMQKVIEKKGIPYAVYVDKAGWLGGTAKRTEFTHFVSACDKLGVRVIFANSPQAKGRIERAFKTIQDRIIPEMRIRKIRSFPAANCFLQEQFIPNYWNKKLTVVPKNLESSYRSSPKNINLNEIFCKREYRVVRTDHTISYDTKLFHVASPVNYPINKQEIEIRTYQDLTQQAFYADRVVKLTLIKHLPEKQCEGLKEKYKVAA